jgi:hypothetical protein
MQHFYVCYYKTILSRFSCFFAASKIIALSSITMESAEGEISFGFFGKNEGMGCWGLI